MDKIFSFIGGDGRNLKLAQKWIKEGRNVRTYALGLEKDLTSLNKAVKGSNCIIGGIPCTRDNETLNAPNSNEKITFTYFFNEMDSETIYIAGAINDMILEKAIKYNIKTVDMLENEEFAIMNAVPTAEGAIEVAMKKTEKTLFKSNILILGFGRIGKILAKRLFDIGADVYVTARKKSDLAWIKVYGYNPIEYFRLNDILKDADIIFNTVPNKILTENELKILKKECLLIELASKPGGIDTEKASLLNIRYEEALGLPGKVAPLSVAEYMGEQIDSLFI